MTIAPCVPWAMTTRDNPDGANGLEPAWLLHRRPFRNTSLILDLFLPGGGRVGAVARGGRRNPALAPFVPLWVQLQRGSGELHTLRQVEPRAAAVSLTGTALYCGFYLNELLVRLLHRDDPHPDLWPAYEYTLRELKGGTPLDVTLRRFEMVLLEEVGYGLVLEHDGEGQPLSPELRYGWVPDLGLIPNKNGHSGADLQALAEDRWTPAVRRMAKQLLREALAPHLGGRPLRSRELFRGTS